MSQTLNTFKYIDASQQFTSNGMQDVARRQWREDDLDLLVQVISERIPNRRDRERYLEKITHPNF